MVVKSIYIRMILYGHPRFPELRHSLESRNPPLSVGLKNMKNAAVD